MSLTVELRPSARRDLRRLDNKNAERVIRALHRFAQTAELRGHVPLRGPLRGLFRLRVADYRVIYRLEEGNQLMIVTEIRHRNEVYD